MSNRFKVLVSTPLTPLSKHMKDRTESAQSLWIATGFTSRAVVDEIAEDALRKGTRVRFITGTFGSQTRRKTFSKLLRLSQKTSLETRIWSCARHRNFHAKLYIWHLKSGGGVAWIGSSNFTDGGLRNEGEVVAGQVVETARDGTAKVIAYQPLPRGDSWIKWDRAREALSREAGFELGTKLPRNRWLSPLAGQSVTERLTSTSGVESDWKLLSRGSGVRISPGRPVS